MTTGTHVPLGTLGEIVSWRAPSEVRFVDLQKAMQASGIDEKLLRDMLPRHAFSRAARKLSDGRIIRRVEENDTTLKFQFTKEYLSGGRYEYALETHLELDKATGAVSCGDTSVGAMAKTLLDNEMAVRKSSDVTRLIQRTFDQNKGDLIPIREQGGVYFVPESHVGLAESVETLLRSIGGALRRFSVSADGASTSKSVAESMNEHFQSMLEEFRKSCDEIVAGEVSPTVQKRRTERVQELRAKLSAYKDILQDYAESIEKGIDAADAELVAKIEGSPVIAGPASVPDLDDLDIGGLSETQTQPVSKPPVSKPAAQVSVAANDPLAALADLLL